MLLEREALGWGAAEAELDLRRRIEPAVGEIAARLGAFSRVQRRLEEFRRQLDDVVERLAPLVARLLCRRDLGQRDTGLRRKSLHRLGEGEPLGHHHEVENAAVLAGGEIEPGHFLVVHEKRRRFLLVEGRKSLPLTPRLLEPHAPADDLRNGKPRAQLVEELRRKAHGPGPVIRWACQYGPGPGAGGRGADCPGYPQGAGGWGRHKAKYGPAFVFAPFRTTGRIPSKIPSKIAPTTSLREDMMTSTNDGAMTRRGVLASAGAGAGAAALGSAPASAQTGAPKTFLLVHGAWHGGWCWRRVADLLQKGGHKVFAPTLTGVGERSHLMSKDIVLDTHITDIVNVIKWEDLNNICLVVHSYGGWPGSGAIEQVPDRISSIVWLDAFKPENGQRGFDFASEFSRKALLTAVEKGEPGRPAPKAEAFHVNEKDRAWVDSKLTAQPNGVALQPIRLTGAREKVAKKTYIRAPNYPQPAFDQAFAECKADKSWRTFETTAAGHDVMVDAPDWLAEVLVEVS